jgi:kynurenine formamidase
MSTGQTAGPASSDREPELRTIAESCSNIGRWGPLDERGTLNHITSETTLRALGLARGGEVVSLGKALVRHELSRHNPPSSLQFLIGVDAVGAGDAMLLRPHGWELTHLDAVGHSFLDGRAYNDRSVEEVVGELGLSFGSVAAAAGGIATRGVLLDVPASRGLPYLSIGDGISRADLETCERKARLRVGKGDVVFVRSGLDAREAVEGVDASGAREGVLPDVIGWLFEREVAVYSGDCIERLPSGYASFPLPLHQVGMARMGLWFLDNPDVERLVRACSAQGRNEFLVVIAPLNAPGATGSALNPVAIF